MTAKEMFEKLGYVIYFETKEQIMYKHKKDGYIIYFYIRHGEKGIDFSYENNNDVYCITYDELQAINKQVEELGWNK